MKIPWNEVSMVTIAASPSFTPAAYGLYALKTLAKRRNLVLENSVEALIKYWLWVVGYDRIRNL